MGSLLSVIRKQDHEVGNPRNQDTNPNSNYYKKLRIYDPER
jgi:hypothetical protein